MSVISKTQSAANIEINREAIGAVQNTSEHLSPTALTLQEIWTRHEKEIEAVTRQLNNLTLSPSYIRFAVTLTLLSAKISQARSEEDLTALLNTLQSQSSEFIQFASGNPSQDIMKFSKVFVQLINLWDSLCKRATTSKHEYVIQMAQFGLQCIPIVRKDIAEQLQEVLEIIKSIPPSNDPVETLDFSPQRWMVPLSPFGKEYLNIILPSLQTDDQLLTIISQNLIKAAWPLNVSEARPLLPEALCTAVDRVTTKLEKYLHINSYKTFVSFLDDTTSVQINVFLGEHSIAITIRKQKTTFEISACWMGCRPYNYDGDMLPFFASLTEIPLKTRTVRERSLEVTFGPKDENQMFTVCRLINDINEMIIERGNGKMVEPFFIKILIRILNNLSPTFSYRLIRMAILDEVWKQFEQTKQLPLFFRSIIDDLLGESDIKENLQDMQRIKYVADELTEG